MCKPCTLFDLSEQAKVNLSRLVKALLQNYVHLTGKDGCLSFYFETRIHEDSQTKANTCKALSRSEKGSISEQINISAAQQKEKNQIILRQKFYQSNF